MISKHLCLFKYFSSTIKPIYLQIGKQSVIDSKEYNNPIVKISLLSSNDININRNTNHNDSINKEDSIHLMLIPKHSDINITLNNCNSNMSIINSNFNELMMNLTNSSINVNEKIGKASSNLSINLTRSKVNIDSIDSMNYLSLKSNSNSQINIKSLSSNYFKADVIGNNIFNCSLLKIKENSLLHYSNDTKLCFNINPLALWTLINVYCVNRSKFINLPLGVLGGKIGSTSFPTLVLFNNDKPAHLIERLHEPVLLSILSKSKMKLGLIMIGLSILAICKAYPYYCFSNETYTRCKLNQYKIKKSMI